MKTAFHFLKNNVNWLELEPRMKEIRLLEEYNEEHSEYYIVTDSFPFTARDFVVSHHDRLDQDKSVSCSYSVINPKQPPTKDRIRGFVMGMLLVVCVTCESLWITP
jgi:hypothetical protein